ncbi:amidohydrolase family protein [Glutamicibacter ardleyensis]|uniref:amidohydrolase family protein n=1 Tax=Glutamicibacter ardleyensis TaxID=225894 RepID=UPI003FD434B9
MLGDDRTERGFAWTEYEQAGALLAFSTDAPTAPHAALPNMFVATTRRSALDSSFEPVQPHLALPLANAIYHATRDSSASVGDGATHGRLEAGYAADFVVLDADPFSDGNDVLPTAPVVRTVVAGQTVYAAEPVRTMTGA